MKPSVLLLGLSTLVLAVPAAHARKHPQYEQVRQLTSEQSALVDKALAREKVLVENIKKRTPLVETYIQDTRPDVKLYSIPVGDHYMLSRIDFGKARFFDKDYDLRGSTSHGFFKESASAFAGITRALGLNSGFTYVSLGFAEMMFLDPRDIDQQHYAFSYVRREFLGGVRTWVFDVQPKVFGMGRFYGRVWIEDQDGNIVRLNGAFTQPGEFSSKHFFHFDSWRTNVQPGIWLPAAIYVEESHRIDGRDALGLKAQTHFWGYSLKLPSRESENVNIKVEDAEDKSAESQDVAPLEATRAWVSQAENNVLDRLEQAGLVAPLTPNGYETSVLDQIVTNLVVPNNLAFSTPVHCRVLLTTTVETTTIGNTILLSRGLLDAMPSEEAIASVISMELAHVALGHHVDTRYAFNDRLLFPDESTFRRIDMYHTDRENEEAVKRGVEYLRASMYSDKLPNAGLFWAQLADRGAVLKQLNTPKLGDSLLRADGTPWMADLSKSAPKINWDDLAQIPALPLGSWLKVDPWDDHVAMLSAKRYAPMNPRDKMPLEVTPVFFRLQRKTAAPVDQAQAPSTAVPPAASVPQPDPAPTGSATPTQPATPPQ
ncbi:hypothetical protein DYQ86_20840 [Acidobacteria bacterium AB60]|nr:hypothetical protein DYQ86_20840 [Acidobacteria bacterium AB60]